MSAEIEIDRWDDETNPLGCCQDFRTEGGIPTHGGPGCVWPSGPPQPFADATNVTGGAEGVDVAPEQIEARKWTHSPADITPMWEAMDCPDVTDDPFYDDFSEDQS